MEGQQQGMRQQTAQSSWRSTTSISSESISPSPPLPALPPRHRCPLSYKRWCPWHATPETGCLSSPVGSTSAACDEDVFTCSQQSHQVPVRAAGLCLGCSLCVICCTHQCGGSSVLSCPTYSQSWHHASGQTGGFCSVVIFSLNVCTCYKEITAYLFQIIIIISMRPLKGSTSWIFWEI